MTLACVRRPTCEARSAAWKASPRTYTPPWKYRTTWRGWIPSMVISAVGTPPSAAAVTVTPTGSGCADVSSRSSRRCSLTSLPAGKADCRRIASRVSRCSVLTEELLSVGVSGSALQGRQAPLLLQQAVGQHNLDDRRDCFLAGPVALKLAGERDPADRLPAGLDHAVKAGAMSLGRGAGDRV